MSDQTAREIAEGLTKPQSDALRHSRGNGLWGDGRFTFVGDRRAAQELYDTLVEASAPNGMWATYRLTPLGIEVRRILQEIDNV